MRIQIETSPGDLYDRLTILEIKLNKIKDEDKLSNIKNEHAALIEAHDKLRIWLEANKRDKSLFKKLDQLISELKIINLNIWDIEDTIRDCERKQDFGPRFVDTARSVYLTNDKRAKIKRQINSLLQSDIAEEKSYTQYSPEGNGHVDKCNQLIQEHSENTKVPK